MLAINAMASGWEALVRAAAAPAGRAIIMYVVY
jgi:hypothetical protein